MSTRQQRLNEVYEYARQRLVIHTKKDFAERIRLTLPAVYSAFGGNKRYLTDSFFKKVCEAFDGVFNLDYLLTGEGNLLTEAEECNNAAYEDWFESIAKEYESKHPSTPLWADTLISIMSSQIKENEALHRELRQSIDKINQLEHDLHQLLQTLKK